MAVATHTHTLNHQRTETRHLLLSKTVHPVWLQDKRTPPPPFVPLSFTVKNNAKVDLKYPCSHDEHFCCLYIHIVDHRHLTLICIFDHNAWKGYQIGVGIFAPRAVFDILGEHFVWTVLGSLIVEVFLGGMWPPPPSYKPLPLLLADSFPGTLPLSSVIFVK